MEVEDADLALAPSSKHGDEGIQEGVEISGAYEENIILQSNESDSEDDGVVVEVGKIGLGLSRRTPMKTLANRSAARTMSGMKDNGVISGRAIADLAALDDELKKYRFTRHVTAFDVDITSLDEHPWRNKNVDILDYFNYGFNERTWMIYCEKQLKLRTEKGLGPQQLREAVAAKAEKQLQLQQQRAAAPTAAPAPAPAPISRPPETVSGSVNNISQQRETATNMPPPPPVPSMPVPPVAPAAPAQQPFSVPPPPLPPRPVPPPTGARPPIPPPPLMPQMMPPMVPWGAPLPSMAFMQPLPGVPEGLARPAEKPNRDSRDREQERDDKDRGRGSERDRDRDRDRNRDRERDRGDRERERDRDRREPPRDREGDDRKRSRDQRDSRRDRSSDRNDDRKRSRPDERSRSFDRSRGRR